MKSEPGKGSTFWFSVPLRIVAETALAPATPTDAPVAGVPPGVKDRPLPAADIHILVAEDNAVNQKVLRLLLERLDYRVHIVSNGKEAVQAAADSPYDIILMDCQMPEMDGYQATAAIRDMERDSRHAIIIALTANVMDGEREKCLESGMDDYLAKPIRAGDLASKLQECTGRLSPAGSQAPPTGLQRLNAAVRNPATPTSSPQPAKTPGALSS